MGRETPEGRQELHNRLKAFWNYTTFGQQELEEQRAWDATLAVIRTFRKEVEERGGTYFVVLIPSLMETYEDRANEIKEQYNPWLRNDDWNILGLRKRFLSELRTGGFRVIDWHREMVQWVRTGTYFHFPLEGHFNENGHRFLAEKLAATLAPLTKAQHQLNEPSDCGAAIKCVQRLPVQSMRE